MDGKQFDQVTKALVAGMSRRGSLGVLAAGLTALGGTALLGHGTAAQVTVKGGGATAEDTDPTCRGKNTLNNRVCRAAGCTRDPDCVCALTVNKQKRCVKVRDRRLRCPTRDECDQNRDCPRNRVCIRVGGCCGRDRQACLELCR